MFGSLGFPEILLILVLALLIFGPKRLPEVGRTIGKGLSEFRRASSDLKRTVNAELALDEDERPPTTRRPEIGAPAGKEPGTPSAPPDLPAPAEAPEATAPRAPVEPARADSEPPIDAPAEEEPAAPAAEDEPATTTH